MQTGQPIINKEAECTDKSGNPNFLLVTKVPLRDSTGNITGLVGIHRDITERKQVEERILEYQKHLKRLAARLTLAEEGERRRIAGAIHDDISQTLAMAKIKLDYPSKLTTSPKIVCEIRQISVCSQTLKMFLVLKYSLLHLFAFGNVPMNPDKPCDIAGAVPQGDFGNKKKVGVA